MSVHKTISENDLLKTAFNDEKVLSADLRTLKRYLLSCTEIRECDVINPRVIEGLPKRKEFIREMISLKIKASEMRLAYITMFSAAIFSLGALLIAIRQEARASSQNRASEEISRLEERIRFLEDKLSGAESNASEKNETQQAATTNDAHRT